jgi:hypothetical protein
MTVRIPIHGSRDGRRGRPRPESVVVVAYALVDDADADLALKYRWNLNQGYARSCAWNGRNVSLHRLILGLGDEVNRHADHINGDRLDNRRENLRSVTPQENAQNQGAHPGSSSPYRGVSWHSPLGKWHATACVGGKRHFLGYFDDELEAARVAARFQAA